MLTLLAYYLDKITTLNSVWIYSPFLLVLSALSVVYLKAAKKNLNSFLKWIIIISSSVVLLQARMSGMAIGLITFIIASELLLFLNSTSKGMITWIKITVLGAAFLSLKVAGEVNSLWISGGLAYLFIKTVEIQKNPGVPFRQRLAYLAFWIPFNSGPIYRIKSFLSDLDKKVTWNVDFILNVAIRFVLGISKVLIFSPIVEHYALLLNQQNEVTVFASAFIYLNFLKVYLEFSGYTDCVISTGKAIGFEFPENFNKPYLASGLSDFWNRWHISLTSWLRDNIFFPMMKQMVRNNFSDFKANSLSFIVVSLFMALLHGVTFNWILYGLWHAVGLIIDLPIQRKIAKMVLHKNTNVKLVKLALNVMTITYISIGFLLMDSIERFNEFWRALVYGIF